MKRLSWWGSWSRQLMLLWQVPMMIIPAAAEKEGWQASLAGIYTPSDDNLVVIHGDLGYWDIGDTASSFPEQGPTPNKAEILSQGLDKYLKLSSEDGNIWAAIGHPLISPISIPLTSGKKIMITQTGTLVDPGWTGYFPQLSQPPCDCVHLTLQESNGYRVAYIFQRPPDYPEHRDDLYGYREVFLGEYDSQGGAYIRDVFEDFSAMDGYSPVGSAIVGIVYELSSIGEATLGDVEIANNITGVPVNITQHPGPVIVTAPEAAAFICDATGVPAPEFRWQRRPVGTAVWGVLDDDATYSGVVTRELTVVGTTTAMTGDRFRCRVSNTSGEEFSDPAVLVVEAGVVVVIPKLRTFHGSESFGFEWDSLHGLNYQVRSSTDGGTWQNEGAVVGGTDGILRFERTFAGGIRPERELFRIVVSMP